MNYPRPVPASVAPAISRRNRRVLPTLVVAVATAALNPLPAGAQETALAAPATAAASTGTGVVRGRVYNAANGRFVGNAQVSVVGTSLIAFTNDFGEYTLRNVPVGTVQLSATYTGQEPLTAPVVVSENQTVEQNLTFNPDSGNTREDGTVVLNEFVVASQRYRTAQEIATNEERYSVTIKNVVSTDAFGDIPSGNVGEFVKFLPGVQIDYGAFNANGQGFADDDASGVSVRGFGPEDTEIMVDGLPVSSATPGTLSRQTALDQMTINNASRVEVSKVATPDMPANSIGGQVNLITKSAFEYAKPSYTGRVFFNINSQNTSLEKTPGPVNKDTLKVSPGLELSVTQPITKNFGISVTGSLNEEFNQSYRAAPQWNNNHDVRMQQGYALAGSVGNPSSWIALLPNSAGVRASTANPVLTRYQVTDTGSQVERRSANVRLDWKPSHSQLLRANVQYSTYESAEAQRRLDFRPLIPNNTGTLATFDWGPDYTSGASGNGTTAMSVTTRDREGDTLSAQLQYELNLGGWSIKAAGSIATSKAEFKDAENGHFSGLDLNLNPGRVLLDDILESIPGTITTFRRTAAGGGVVDYTTLGNWVFDGTNARSGPAENENVVGLYKVDVSRDLSFLPFLGSNRLTFQTGYRHDEDKTEKSGLGTGYREILRPGASYTVADILDDNYLGQSAGFGAPAQQWVSTYKLWAIEQERDIFYVPDIDESTNTRVENYNSYVGQQKSITEETDAFYGMLNGSFLSNRLSVVAGARQESKKREGYGPFVDGKWDYLKRADGGLWTSTTYPNGVQFSSGSNRPLFATNAAGDALRAQLTSEGIWFPTTAYGSPTSGTRSLASRMLQYQAKRPINQKVTGDPSYTFAASYKLTEKIDLKASWSRSFGLPRLESSGTGLLSGNDALFTITEYTDLEEASNAGVDGEIRVANPGLKPEVSNNIDLEVAYYTDQGGKFSVGFWHKDVTNRVVNYTAFSGDPVFDLVVSSLGLTPEDYPDWRVVTAANSSAAQKTMGWELDVRHDFRFVGEWGRRFQAFATFSITDLGDPEAAEPQVITNPDGTTVTLVPSTPTITQRADRYGSAGLQFSSRRFSAQIRGTYRNDNEIARTELVPAADGTPNFLRRFEPAETRVDLNFTYVLSSRYSLFVSARDVFNGERELEVRDDLGLLPAYAQRFDLKEFGVDWTIGVTGRF